MTLVAAAVCPHPPLLVPELASGAATELTELRLACDEAVADLVAVTPDVVAVVGAGGPVMTSMQPYGVDVSVCPEHLPLSLALGCWLLDRAGWEGARRYHPVDPDTDPVTCSRIGRDLASLEPRVALLAMGDGAARRTEKAPGYLDARAEAFDAGVAAAFSSADPVALAALDPVLASALLAVGRAAWQVLAGAAAGRSWRASRHGIAAPYGVAYFTASWGPA